RVLRRFKAEKEWVLGPGDMLYLPPGWAHDGVALGPCFTYSIGFRAPSRGEIAREFLGFLQERVDFDGVYADRGAKPARHAAEIPARMVQHAVAAARKIRWNRRDVARLLGCYLSEPKPHVVFPRPREAVAPARWASRLRAQGLRLDARSRMLYRGVDFFLNGERVAASPLERAPLARLADERSLPAGSRVPRSLARRLHAWYDRSEEHTSEL